MYRYVKQTPLDNGIRYGSIIKDGDLSPKTTEKFLANGMLVEEITPPLSEIPAFEQRAAVLNKAGIETLQDLIEADASQAAKKAKKSVTTFRRWQLEAMAWLAPEPQQEKKP